MKEQEDDKSEIQTLNKRAFESQENGLAVMACEVVHVHKEHVTDKHRKHERAGNPLKLPEQGITGQPDFEQDEDKGDNAYSERD